MSVTEILGGLGSWELSFREDTPDHVLEKLGMFGHLVVVDGEVDVEAAGDGILADAKYAGVCRGKGTAGDYSREGSGLRFWVSDEDGKDHGLLTEVPLASATLAQVVTALIPPTVMVGTVHAQVNPATRYTGSHIYESRWDALLVALVPFGAELRINPDFSVDVGTAAQLYNTESPDRIIVRKGAGSDIDLTAIGGEYATEETVWDYTTDVQLLGETVGTGDEPGTVFATGSASAPSVPWLDPQGNPVKFVRLISESGTSSASAAVRAQLQINRFNRVARSVTVTADDFVTAGSFTVGDSVYVYDPDTGIVNAANEVTFQGQVLHPDVVRVSEDTWPVVEGMTVAWRTDAGVWLDLTTWVVWERPGSGEITVGDLPKTLAGPSSNPVQDRIDAARGNPSTKVPKTPTGLSLSTSSSLNAAGGDSAIITAEWDAVTQYVDDTTVALHHYEVRFRPQFRAPAWTGALPFAGTEGDLPVVAGLDYDVQVRAVSTGGVPSAWSSTVSILSAADSTAPGTPSDPTLEPYFGLLRVRWDGLNSVGGGMPADFNRVDVHISATSGFTPSAATLVSSSTTGGIVGHVDAPYGALRYVKLVAYDHNGNASAPSGQVSGATVQVNDGDIQSLNVGKLVSGTVTADMVMAGRFATALTGARREMNAVGFQAFDASNNLMISLDGINNLLTGKLQTALTGRRIVTGSGGSIGELQFIAPDGTQSLLRGYTATTGVEAIGLAVPISGAASTWNALSVDSNEGIFITSKFVGVTFGGTTSGTLREFRVEYLSDKSVMSPRDPRLQITPNNTRSWITAGGAFYIYEDAATDILRMQIDGGGSNYFYHAAGFGTYFSQRTSGGTVNTRFWFDDADVWFQWAATNQRARLWQFTGGNVLSPFFGLMNNNSYGITMFYEEASAGTNGRLQIRDASTTIYQPVWASGFIVSSSAETKTDVAPRKPGSLRKLRDEIEVVDFRRRRPKRGKQPKDPDSDVTVIDHDEDDGPEFDDRQEIGVIAENMPAELVVDGGDGGPMVDVMAYLSLVAASVQELAADVDNMKKGKAA